MSEIFALSPQLREIVFSKDQEVQKIFRGRISLEEFITLPEFGGHLIFRYEVHDSLTNTEEIDHIENTFKDGNNCSAEVSS